MQTPEVEGNPADEDPVAVAIPETVRARWKASITR